MFGLLVLALISQIAFRQHQTQTVHVPHEFHLVQTRTLQGAPWEFFVVVLLRHEQCWNSQTHVILNAGR